MSEELSPPSGGFDLNVVLCLHSSLHPQAGRPIRLHLHHPERTTALRHPQEQRQEGASGGVWPRRPHRGGENLTTLSLY